MDNWREKKKKGGGGGVVVKFLHAGTCRKTERKGLNVHLTAFRRESGRTFRSNRRDV